MHRPEIGIDELHELGRPIWRFSALVNSTLNEVVTFRVLMSVMWGKADVPYGVGLIPILTQAV